MRRLLGALVATALLGAACSDGELSDDGAPGEIVVVTHDSFAISEEVLTAFQRQSGVAVRILESGDAGTMVAGAILTRDNPTGDVLYGVDNTMLSRALEENLFVPYESPMLEVVPDSLEIDEEHRVTPIDFGDVCLNYDKAALADRGLTVPGTLRDLTKPEYRGELVVEDPATSSPGLAFLLSTIAQFPEGSDYPWQQFWRDLAVNDVVVTSGWEEAYFGAFSGGSEDGERSLVVSYASSPPAGVFFAGEELSEAPTGVIHDGCFRQIEFAGILQGSKAQGTAALFIDYMLSIEFQEDIPLNMFVFPANEQAQLPDVFVQHAAVPEDPNILSPDEIEAGRARWIEEWTGIVR